MNRGRGGSRRPNRGGGRFNKQRTVNSAALTKSIEQDQDEVDDSEGDGEYDDFVVEIREPSPEGRNPAPAKTRRRSSNKALIQRLQMSVENQEMIETVLRDLQINGNGHDFEEKLAFNARETKRNEAYWNKVGERKLVIEGGVSADWVGESQFEIKDETYSSYAVKKLLQCGFEKGRCLVALSANNGDLGAALESLLCSCCKLGQIGKENPDYTEEKFKEAVLQRQEEVMALESIYGDAFTEVIADSIWTIKLSLPFLLEAFKPKMRGDNGCKNKTTKKRETSRKVCRFYLEGNCKFGDTCRFSHLKSDDKTDSVDETTKNLEIPTVNNETVDPSLPFILEVRFSKESLYPFESPVVAFYSTNELIPSSGCLNVTLRLVQEAKDLSTAESPAIFCLASLLENEDEIMECFKTPPSEYSLPAKKSNPAQSIRLVQSNDAKIEAANNKPKSKQPQQSSDQLTIQERNRKLKQQFERLQVNLLGLSKNGCLKRVVVKGPPPSSITGTDCWR